MRPVAIALVLAACDKGALPAPPPSPKPVPVPVVPDDASVPAPLPAVKLVPKLPPLGLRTGAWMDITDLDGAHISELRVTAPRVRKLAIQIASLEPTIVTLDPKAKGMHVIPYGSDVPVRIAIAELLPTTSLVAKFEVWGQPSSKAYASPPSAWVSDGAYGPCPDLEWRTAQVEKEHARNAKDCEGSENPLCMEDQKGPPSCDLESLEVESLPEPWTDIKRFCAIDDITFGPTICSVAVSTASATELAVFPTEIPGPQRIEFETRVADLVAGGAPELVFAYKTDYYVDSHRMVVICQANPLSCSSPKLEPWAFDQPTVFR